MQVPAGSGQPLPEVLTARLQQLGAHRIRHAEDLAEDVDHALLAVEAQQHAGRAPEPRLVHQQADVRGHGALIRRVQVRRGVEPVRVAGERQRRKLAAAALHVQDVVDGDPVEPRSEAAPPLERGQPGEGLDQDLLRGVLGVLRLREHAEGKVVDPGLVAAHELFARVGHGHRSGREAGTASDAARGASRRPPAAPEHKPRHSAPALR